jgi:hypothetical protein
MRTAAKQTYKLIEHESDVGRPDGTDGVPLRIRAMRRTMSFALTLFALTLSCAGAQTAKVYGFLIHAAFFSLETKQANLLDPQVFVPDAASPAGVGPQGITHVAGYRPAYGVDDPATVLSNSQGKSIGMTLRQWFAARGAVTLSATSEGNTSAALVFSGLVPRGRYSMFENHFGIAGVSFTPLDGSGQTNSFSAAADGSARLTVLVPGAVTHAEGVLLVYHSDGVDHGILRGDIGENAHHQLVMRVP